MRRKRHIARYVRVESWPGSRFWNDEPKTLCGLDGRGLERDDRVDLIKADCAKCRRIFENQSEQTQELWVTVDYV